MRRRLAIAFALLFALALVILLQSTEWLRSLGGRLEGSRLERASHSPQFAGGRFRNPEPPTKSGSNREMLRRQFFGKEQRAPSAPVPVVARNTSDYANPPSSGLRATWIGWSSVLVEIDGAVVLTDPIWSERCSPSTLAGPKRLHPPPISLDALPRVDVVVISHDHYDHLDMTTARILAGRGTRFAVPLGIGAHLERWGIAATQIHELDWNETLALGTVTLTATRARHYSGRNPRRKNDTLWASWVIKGPRHRVFFSGDTGYSTAFKTIGTTHGPFDLTLIKIGASDPSWEAIHMSPEDAIKTHLDLQGRVMLPVHWATFNLAFHAWSDPADRTVAAATKSRVTLIIPRPGEMVEPGLPHAPDRWWNPNDE